MNTCRGNVLLFKIPHGNSQRLIGMIKGISPSFDGCQDKGFTQLRIILVCLFKNINAVFRKIETVVVEEKCCQFIGIDTAVQNRMVLVVSHCRGHIDAVSQKEIDGEGLGNNL